MRGIAVINCPAQTKRISELVKTSSFKVRQNPQTVVGFSSVQRIMMSQTLRQFMALNIEQFIVSGESSLRFWMCALHTADTVSE